MATPAPAEPFDLKLEDKLRKVLDALGYELRETPPAHARLEAVGEGIRVTLYASGKLLLQGKRAAEVRKELEEFELIGKRSGTGTGTDEALIGTDETGKGDYFGPLVVAAVCVEPGLRAKLVELGVRDSKTIGDGPVRKLAAEVKKLAPHAVVVVGPKKYNELYPQFGNLNKLLGWGHARAIEDVLEKCPGCTRVLTDEFARDRGVVERALMERGRKVRYEQRPRAEEETAVAAASVIARAEFLDRLAGLSKQFEVTLEKGASAKVETAARAFVAKWGREKLGEVAKLHFQTTARVLA